MFGNIASNKSNIYERDWCKFVSKKIIPDCFSIDNSTQLYLEKINLLLDTYAPLKRIDKCKLKFKSKPWITLGF